MNKYKITTKGFRDLEDKEISGDWIEVDDPKYCQVYFILTSIFLAVSSYMVIFFWGGGHDIDFLDWSVAAGFLIVLIPIHEMIHAVSYPDRGEVVYMGVSVTDMVFFTYTEIQVSRGRLVFVLLLPFVLLTVLPIFMLLVSGVFSRDIFLVSVSHAFACGGDVFYTLLILVKIPKKYIIKNMSGKTYMINPMSNPAVVHTYG